MRKQRGTIRNPAVKNFLVIQEAELEFGRFIVLIGPRPHHPSPH
jgi:hypothetical protein